MSGMYNVMYVLVHKMNWINLPGVGYMILGVKIKVSLLALHASHQGLSWGGEVNNWTESTCKSVGMDNELGYSLPSPTIQLKILLKVPQADVFVFNIVHCVKSKRYVDLILFF